MMGMIPLTPAIHPHHLITRARQLTFVRQASFERHQAFIWLKFAGRSIRTVAQTERMVRSASDPFTGVENNLHQSRLLFGQARLNQWHNANITLCICSKAKMLNATLPIFGELTARQQEHVVASIREFFDSPR